MKHDISTALHAYWVSCQTDAAVRAGGLSAAALAPLLPDLFLLDLDPLQEARFRFCGAAIATRYGRDLTYESFMELWSPDDRHTLEHDFRLMASPSGGMVMGVMGETMGGGFIAFEMLLLPLVGENGGAGVIGSMVRIGGHDESNRVRGRIVAQFIRSTRFLPAMPAASMHGRPQTTETLPVDTGKAPRRYGHLTVVSSN